MYIASLVLSDRDDEVTIQAGDNGIRFLLVSGKPLEEPVAWYAPKVMNHAGAASAGLHRASILKEVKRR
jgi:quercetin 2,3-dioxygenase